MDAGVEENVFVRELGIVRQKMRERIFAERGQTGRRVRDEQRIAAIARSAEIDDGRRIIIAAGGAAGGKSKRKSVVGVGAVTMKITSSTSSTSMNGMTFGSDVSSKCALRSRNANAAIAASLFCRDQRACASSKTEITRARARSRVRERAYVSQGGAGKSRYARRNASDQSQRTCLK